MINIARTAKTRTAMTSSAMTRTAIQPTVLLPTHTAFAGTAVCAALTPWAGPDFAAYRTLRHSVTDIKGSPPRGGPV